MELNPTLIKDAINQYNDWIINPEKYKGRTVLTVTNLQIWGSMLVSSQETVSKLLEYVYNQQQNVESLNKKRESIYDKINELYTIQLQYGSNSESLKKNSFALHTTFCDIEKPVYEKVLSEKKSISHLSAQYIGHANRETYVKQLFVITESLKAIINKPINSEVYLNYIKFYDLDDSLGLNVQYKKPEPKPEPKQEMEFDAKDFDFKLVTLACDNEQTDILVRMMELGGIAPSHRTLRVLPYMNSGYFVINLSEKQFIVTDNIEHYSGCKLVYIKDVYQTIGIQDDIIDAYFSKSEMRYKAKQEAEKSNTSIGKLKQQPVQSLYELRESVHKLHEQYIDKLTALIEKSISVAVNTASVKGVQLTEDDIKLYRSLLIKHYSSQNIDIECKECNNLVKAELVECESYIQTNIGLIKEELIIPQQDTGVNIIFYVQGSNITGYHARNAKPVYKIRLIEIN